MSVATIEHAPDTAQSSPRKAGSRPLKLGTSHAVFVGLQADIAAHVSAAARGEWTALDEIRPVGLEQLEGIWSSEFAWLPDGSVAAPVLYFLPTGGMTL